MTPPIEQMRAEVTASKAKKAKTPKQPKLLDEDEQKRIKVDAEGSGGVKGIVVPKHLIEGNPKAHAMGLKKMMAERARVYGPEHRDPLTLGQIGKIHKQALQEHFDKPLHEQLGAEKEALGRLRAAKFIKPDRNTLDESEKLDTVRHEYDEQGRAHVGYASKGVAGHALFPKGHGDDMDYKVINTCPGQTTGCGGGVDANGIVDTKKGTCFAPNAESQYAAAMSRRAGHAIAKFDPAMTKDWILAHTGSMREAANDADKSNKRMLFRPNVVDETDTTSRHVIRHLNAQRAAESKPPIISNQYGKTNELHDPENGTYVTHSNIGPKVKHGQEITENIGRDKARVRNTIMAADNRGDFTNEQGNKTPPRGSYFVTDMKRGSPLAKRAEQSITHAKYWSTGRPTSELSEEEKAEGPSGHFGPNGKPTTPDKAHFGHTTLNDKAGTPLRFDYQKQHVLHPRLVNVPERKENKKTGKMEMVEHMIPTDSRFKDEDFLPKNRFMTKNGKVAGHILMTTPTESTDNLSHQTTFTHNVSPAHITHAEQNNGEYVVDKPEEQIKAKGKEYIAPKGIKFYAEGGHVYGRHPGFSDDDFHAFPEQNLVAQRHLAMRLGDDEAETRKPVRKPSRKMADGGAVEPDKDTMLASLMLRKAPNLMNIKDVGVNEAPDLPIKAFVSPNGGSGAGLPIGGVDFQPLTPGNQMMPMQPGQPQGGLPPPPGQPPMPPQGGMPPPGAPGAPPPKPGQPQSNILALTPQGQAMQAMRPNPQAMPQRPGPAGPRMARGGSTHDIQLTERPL